MSSIFKSIGKGIQSLLGFETPKVPEVVVNTPAPQEVLEKEPEPAMPTPNSAVVKTAQRKSMAEQRRRRGRASTLLSMNDDGLGG